MDGDNYGSEEDIINDGFEDENKNSDDSEGSHDYNEHPEEEEQEHNQEEYHDQTDQGDQPKVAELIGDSNASQPNQRRITSPFMTKFEKAKIIGIRAVQISKNAPLYLKSENVANMNWDPITIAQKELVEKRIPFIIRRYLPDSSYEDWKLNELKTFD